ncbi:MAG: type I restriction-modification system endonuclease [Gemella sp.]|nr:type I restriction-modification system endonuclease [Gemella sp.]
MKSNFEIFPEELKILETIAKNAEDNVYSSPNTSLVKLRQFAEKIVDIVIGYSKVDATEITKLVDRIRLLDKTGLLGDNVSQILYYMRTLGNKAAHDAEYGSEKEAIQVLELAHYLSKWFLKTYVDENIKLAKFKFEENKKTISYEKVRELEERLALQEEEFKIKLDSLTSQYNTDLAELKARSMSFEASTPLDESSTRVLIDQQLRNAGWIVDSVNLNNKSNKTMPEENKNLAIAEWKCGSGYADYALFRGLELVGLIEAKKSSKDVSNDLEQAKEYARNVEKIEGINDLKTYGDYKVPFIYSSNGRKYIKQLEEKSGIWFWDSRYPKEYSRAMQAWHSPEDLKQKLESADFSLAKEKLEAEPMPDIAGREYQKEAIKAVEEGIIQGKRRMLVAMATGTGKTRTALSLMYRLLTTKTVRRILFLVDRTSLGEQTLDSLKDSKISGLSMSSIFGVKGLEDINPDIETKIHISTVQGLVKRIFHQEDATKVPSIGTYDFIIVDEAHRGYTEDRDMSQEELLYADEEDFKSQYRKVIDYFDAKVLGLTATPALHTTEIFGAPIYSYTYSRAVLDGYLVDHNPPYLIETGLSKTGIHLDKTQPATVWNKQKGEVDKAYLEDELDFDVTDFNRKIMVEDFNRVVIRELITMETYGDESAAIDAESDFKTLVFATNNLHADSIVRIFKEEYSKIGKPIDDDAILKITGSIKNPEQAIKRFKNEKYPNIVVTVDLLTTGIDVPNIRNLVFLRRVKSRILYEQMLGRATRLAQGKESFRIYDAVGIYDALEEVSNMKQVAKAPHKSLEDSLVDVLETKQEAFEYHRDIFIAKLQRRKATLSDKQIEEIEERLNIRSYDRYIQELGTMDIDRFKALEDKLKYLAKLKAEEKYGVFISDAKDKVLEVTRGYGDGNDRPEDYLDDFTAFIKLNQDKIDAIKLVVTKPSDLTKADLKEIQNVLAMNNFKKDDLNMAWKSSKNVDITADIVAFIRQAALDVPLFDKAERVKTIIAKVKELKEWNSQQEYFIEKISKQLVASDMIIHSADDLKDYRVFATKGEHKKIKEIFTEEDLSTIINLINTNLYI